MGAEDLSEGSYLTAGVAAVGVINNPPHPNATKVYLDYLLSREAQLEFSQATGYVSRRTDVPTDHLPGYVIPKPGVTYDDNYKEAYFDLRDEITGFIQSALGG
jgi:ABC-type Fe3+ transport system substrate-binding protein